MENIKIPSPSAILDHPPTLPSTGAHSKPSGSPKKSSSSQNATNAITNKPKQSKSRNGCITCKTKRLKCDESKPTCLQCKKRNVECGGYKKDFKWRPFEESNIVGKASVAKSKKVTSSPTTTGRSNVEALIPPEKDDSTRAKDHSTVSNGFSLGSAGFSNNHKLPQKPNSSRNHLDRLPVTQNDLLLCADDFISHHNLGKLGEDIYPPSLTEISPSDQSPWLSDISIPTTELDTSPGQLSFAIPEEEGIQAPENFSFEALLEGDNEDIEDIVRQSDRSMKPGILELAERGMMPHAREAHIASTLLAEPNLGIASPELLVVHFDRFTCGILSVKDGAHENPWRTLIWPLAKDTPALYHAIFSLAAFHSSKENPSLRVHGVDHMRQSITCMVQDIQNMRADAALATSLALAFADTWDQHTRTCIQHLRGAKALVTQVIDFGLQSGISGADLDRVRFLYNTWLYMDVIARLTSREECGNQDMMNMSLLQLPSDAVHEIDPLMGCATTLFPLIDRVARLIQRVRMTTSNSISLVSEAIELKRSVEQWEPPDWFEPPEDPTSEVQHSIQTAHAYRWATLLYLHQAVPEMPSESAAELSKRVLMLLATVPPSSRTTIIQMFPLLAAGCEAEQDEDRQWVLNRWNAVQSRLMLGSIDRCIEVVQEVWTRRDEFEAEKQRRQVRTGRSNSHAIPREAPVREQVPFLGAGLRERSSKTVYTKDPWRRPGGEDRAVSSRITPGNPRRGSTASPLENIEFENTVRGKLHWINVMQEWGWEVFIG